MSARPLVTAILPSWNAEAFIRETLACLDAQTWPALEVLVGDDASTDGTPEILRAWAEGRPGVTLILRDRNLGWVGNCNDLMARARGEYLFFAFHDDLIEPTYVEKLVGALEADPGASLAFSKMRWVQLDGSEGVVDGKGTGRQGTPYRRAARMISFWADWWTPNRGVFRASAYRRIGGMKRNAAGEFSADFPWLLHLAIIGRFVLVPEVLCTKVMRKQSLSLRWKHTPEQLRARNWSAAREVAASDLSFRRKVGLWLLLRSERLRKRWRRELRRQARRTRAAALSRTDPGTARRRGA